jgi:hypothetical protein
MVIRSRKIKRTQTVCVDDAHRGWNDTKVPVCVYTHTVYVHYSNRAPPSLHLIVQWTSCRPYAGRATLWKHKATWSTTTSCFKTRRAPSYLRKTFCVETYRLFTTNRQVITKSEGGLRKNPEERNPARVGIRWFMSWIILVKPDWERRSFANFPENLETLWRIPGGP